ncbi:zinc finger domain-containing ubiquitin ligase [Encephalitozoon romaleae SJ-2008]|uniref:Zinc finger domain-containing ubiquitin ligase n=1 Tax=Encephalitozoon romaleae (strain SJ-2008) TaxID=1178016 RepID=I7AS82_ENCRO|nr:zinc finger domain-containing ubiquitin ligase [Encephalitozoon romaleae SJ-2008]AFN83277.1 zinc finger domain-containing ubiquitin ligase [Encephalitozoon romaleae SJ-2008]
MARRNGNNNFLNIMRSMLSFLDARIESSDADTNNSPGGVFMSRLRSRLVDLINGRMETRNNEGDERAASDTEGSSRSVGRRRRARKNLSGARQEAPTVEERSLVDRCSRMINETGERPVRGRRQVRAASVSQNRRVDGSRGEMSMDPVMLTTSIVVTGNERSSSQSSLQNEEGRSDVRSDEESRSLGNRGFRVVFPRVPSQELRFLFLTPQSEGARGNVIYEIQINFDIFDASTEPPVTATKESLKKTDVVKATKDDETCECTICMSNFSMNQKLRVLPCDHKFHTGCVDKWLLGHSNKCPVCRKII